MNDPSSLAHAATDPPLPPARAPWLDLPELAQAYEPAWIALALVALVATATWRAALQQALPSRVLPRARDEEARARLAPLLERADAFATSATVLQSTVLIVFLALLFDLTASGGSLNATSVTIALAIAAPVLVFAGNALPTALARARGDELLVRLLPAFAIAQLPIAPLSWVLDLVRGAVLRVLRVPLAGGAQRKFVEGLRDVLEDADPTRELDETERELIENVMDFRDVDAAEVMTPRTEVAAVDVEGGVEAAEAAAVEHRCSRIPVFEDSVDTVIGTVSALDLAAARAREQRGEEGLRSLLRPPFLVPETKLVSELLQEFRQRREKMAIVVDEYGGTAGLVTVADAMREIFGELAEPAEAAETIRTIGPSTYEVPAALHVSDVNESLDLDLPEEEDYETLAGFVLAQLGHLPKAGESFEHEGTHYHVAEASDRRVLKVQVSKVA